MSALIAWWIHNGAKATPETIFNAGLEAAAKVCEPSTSEILLLAGEMTAGEMRAVKAVLDSRVRSIRALKE